MSGVGTYNLPPMLRQVILINSVGHTQKEDLEAGERRTREKKGSDRKERRWER